MPDEPAAGAIRMSEASGKWIVAGAVLGSAVVALDATVVNVALPSIGRDLHAGVAGAAMDRRAYLVTLAALILPGGSLGDRFGRRRIFPGRPGVVRGVRHCCAGSRRTSAC